MSELNNRKPLYTEDEWEQHINHASGITSEEELAEYRHEIGKGHREVLVDYVSRPIGELASKNIVKVQYDADSEDYDAASDSEDSSEFGYEILANPYERMEYVHLTDELISHMDGTVGDKPDYVIFLDKSARPVNWMVRELWDSLAAKDRDGNTQDRPQSLFVQIDARREAKGRRIIDDTPETTANLRALFAIDEPVEGTEMMEAPTILDGKKVLVVDEVRTSGDTIANAVRLLKKAYPSADIDDFSWMKAPTDAATDKETNSPRWYEKGKDRYRLVVDMEKIAARYGDDWRETLLNSDPRITRGQDWIAGMPKHQPKGVMRLLKEIHHMADDIDSGKLPYLPAETRTDSDTEKRVQAQSGLTSDEMGNVKRWMKERFWPSYADATIQTDEAGPLSQENARMKAKLVHDIHQENMRQKSAGGRRQPRPHIWTPVQLTERETAYLHGIGYTNLD